MNTFPKPLIDRLLETSDNIGGGKLKAIIWTDANGQDHTLTERDFDNADGQHSWGWYTLVSLIFEALMIRLTNSIRPCDNTQGDMLTTYAGQTYPIELKRVKSWWSEIKGGMQCLGRLHIAYWEHAKYSTWFVPEKVTSKGLAPLTKPPRAIR
jgi:hypothetical protein